ncbi:MAG TPA: alpha/beta fold hydrolase [Opitutaceae bacterium]
MSLAPQPLRAQEPETVVLLHGLGLGAWAMQRIEHALERDGYRVINVSYPSRSLPLEQIAREWIPALLTTHQAEHARVLHFVTHSMGGIALRGYLRSHTPTNLGRVVMIAPPNHGTRLVDRISDWWAFRAFTGVNGVQLGTGAEAFPQRLGPWTQPAALGIIAGDRTLNPLFSHWVGPDANDGKVSVASTRLEGMTAHLVLPISHTWLIYRRPTIDATRTFLRRGQFDPVNE